MAAAPTKEDLRKPWVQLVAVLDRAAIDLVFDIGAHKGEYASILRREGYAGRIVSFEPQTIAHAALQQAAAGDPTWTVAPRIAIGGRTGETRINISAETDMSSILPLDPKAKQYTPSSEMVAEEAVGLTTLADVYEHYATPGDTVFVKVDTQGYEPQVIEGAAAVMGRIKGWQVELSLELIYAGETDWRTVADSLLGQGYTARLVMPGYFSRHIGKMLQFDMVFARG
jgi:FkbM family methyltransferase